MGILNLVLLMTGAVFAAVSVTDATIGIKRPCEGPNGVTVGDDEPFINGELRSVCMVNCYMSKCFNAHRQIGCHYAEESIELKMYEEKKLDPGCTIKCFQNDGIRKVCPNPVPKDKRGCVLPDGMKDENGNSFVEPGGKIKGYGFRTYCYYTCTETLELQMNMCIG